MFERYEIEFHNVMGHWHIEVWLFERQADGSMDETRLLHSTIDGTALEGDVPVKGLLWEAFCAVATAEDAESQRPSTSPHGG